MPKIADRVIETSTSTGTGAIALGGSVTNYRTFASAFDDQDEVYYAIVGSTGWELGIGTFSVGTNAISRDTVHKSSNSNGLVNFGAGTKNVYVTTPEQYFADQLAESTAASISLAIALG